MGTSDGNVIGTTQVVNSGSAARCWNLVFVSEGYMNNQLVQYAQDVTDFNAALFATYPFDELSRAINVFRIDVASNESGADDPATCGGSGATVATYFDGTFCGDDQIQRLLTVKDSIVRDVVDAEVPQSHAVVVLVNSTIFGGSGGRFAVASRTGDWINTVLHELGHSPFGLADEYEYWAGCGMDTDRNNHPNTEPSAPNVTTSSSGKWRTLRTGGVPLPSSSNADCSQCDTQANPLPVGTVGAFEGAHYYHCGAYRPEFDCMMRNLGVAFCAVCRCRIWKTLAQHMPQVFLGNTNSKELHRVQSTNGNCQLCEIKQNHRVYFNSIAVAHSAGFDNCHWCLGGSTH